MIYKIYAVRDIKAGKYLNIWTGDNDHTAERDFRSIRKDKTTLIGQYPEDFELHGLGTFDPHTGVITSEVRFITGGAVENGI